MDSTDNFVEYGTPLEPLEEDEVPSKKPVTVQDQIAVDDQGRRRFHGAFTGGFSAGYYNTVGSKEGWTPSDFKSSRQSRAESSTAAAGRKGQHVHDFMDEEDLGAFGIAPQILRATNDFEQREGRKRARPTPDSSGPIPGIPVLEQIIQPVKETIGIRILQRMGWRPGQGVGPRLSKAERKIERETRKEKKLAKASKEEHDENEPMVVDGEVPSGSVKVYGCHVPAEFRKPVDDSDSDESILDLTDITFAPDDFEDPLCNPKENTFGLGYAGLDRSALSFGSIDLFGGAAGGIKSRVENRKLNIRGEAFGIGAFEDEDEEVYNRSDIAEYDFSLETPEERRERRGNERKVKSDKKSEKSETGILPGFTRAKNPAPLRKYFPPPPLPKNFEPKHYIRRSRFDQAPPGVADEEEKKKLGLDRHRLTIGERQVLLGEEKIPLTPAEELELEIKTKEEAELAKRELAIEKAERLQKFTQVLQTYSASKPVVASAEGRPAGFKPFMKNPEKQERYEKYMTLIAAGFQECLKDLQPLDMTEWERERERMEFERASALYKPMGSIISSRFVSAQSHDISHLVPTKQVLEEKDPSQDPKVAAKMSLFGKLTHKTYEWHPDRLLCKRFNVPHPYPESKMIGVLRRDAAVPVLAEASTSGEGVSSSEKPPPPLPPPVKKSLFDNLDFSKPPPGLLPLPPPPLTSEEGICPPGTEEELPATGSSEKSPVDPEPSKPSIDLFKEIFENSSSEESEEEEASKSRQVVPSKTRFESIDSKSNREKRTTTATSKDDEPKSNNPPPQPQPPPVKSKGIFDNLDFSKLLTPKDKSKDVEKVREDEEERRRRKEDEKRRTTKVKEEESDDVEEDVFGPLPPPLLPIPVNSTMSKDTNNTKGKTCLNVLSKGSRVNPINSSSLPPPPRQRNDEDEGIMWVEKRETRESESVVVFPSSKGKESNKSHDNKKEKKKLKKSSSHRVKKGSTKSKSKKSKKRKEAKHKKSKKKKDQKRGGESSDDESDDEEDSSNSSSSPSSEDELPIQIHSSINNRALLAKLKSMF